MLGLGSVEKCVKLSILSTLLDRLLWNVDFPHPQGKVEDLGRMELGGYAIGAVEDCSKRLSDYISMDVLSAIQRAGAAFSWVPKEPYNEDACLLDFDVLLMEPRKLEKTLITSIMWWADAIRLANQR